MLNSMQAGAGRGVHKATEQGGAEVREIDTKEVGKQLKTMASRKAADTNGIVAEMLKEGGAALVDAILILYNEIVNSHRQYLYHCSLQIQIKLNLRCYLNDTRKTFR